MRRHTHLRRARSRLIAGALVVGLGLTLASAAVASVTHYFYDPVGRLIGLTATGSQIKGYQYDKSDSRTQYFLAPPTPPGSSSAMTNGQSIFQGGALTSPKGAYTLSFQEDGNIVLYHGSTGIWATNTYAGSTSIIAGAGQSAYLIQQGDGNLVLYDIQNKAVWASGVTAGTGNYVLSLQDDGNLVIYPAGSSTSIWSSKTSGK